MLFHHRQLGHWRRSVRRWCLTSLLLLPAGGARAQAEFPAVLELVPNSEAGIGFVHTDGGSGRRYIMESVNGSLALFDYDGDGLTDIYLVNGAALRGTQLDPPPRNRLYRNLGHWKFTDVTAQAGVGDIGYGMGVVVGDYDQDGDPDLFVSNFGTNTFYVNQGDGTFVDSTAVTGLTGPPRFGAGNSFFDMDGDGDLDLYCASYVRFEYENYKVRTIAGHQFHTGPNDYPPAADFLYRNNGNGSFSDVSAWSGIAQLAAPGMGVLAADFDEDGDCDMFVANDQTANFLLTNDGQGRFVDDGVIAGIAFDGAGKANGNMGVEFADLDGDSLLDFITTTYQEEMPVYYQAIDPGFYVDSTNLARIDRSLTAHVNWGVGAVDFDNDGDRDLYLSCGHFLDNIRFIDDRTDVRVADYLLANDGPGKFSRVAAAGHSFLQVVESGRAAGFDDLDNDGDVDIVVLNFNAPPSLGRTRVTAAHQHLALRLIGTRSNRDGLGCWIEVVDSRGRRQRQTTFSGRGYESYYGRRSYFGLGDAHATEVRVRWPSGLSESYAIKNPTMTLIEGHGRSLKR